MAHDHSDSKIPVGWQIVYVLFVLVIFWFLFVVDESPRVEVPNRPLTYLDLLVADTYLTQEELQAVLEKAKSGNRVRSILVNDYKIADNTIDAYSAAIANKDASLQKLLLEEFKKVTEEIKLRLGNIDTWFHYKFVLLGGVFLILAGSLEKVIDFAYPWRPKTQAPYIKSKQISEEHKLVECNTHL